MTNRPPPSLPKWIFIVADLFLLGACAWTIWQVLPTKSNFDHMVLITGIVAWMFGAWICVKPWLEEFHAQNKHLENETLATAVEQIQRMEEVGARIQSATGSWQSAQEAAIRTAATAGEIQEKIRADMKDFMEFQERIANSEKKHMTLEIEKLRRVEADWLQVSARMLDHTFLLNQAAQRSGQANLISQLGNFQTALRDTARRMGLVPFVPVPGEVFDTNAHQMETADTEPPEGSLISEVMACGFTFQGQLLRRALVRVHDASWQTPAGEGPSAEAAVEISEDERPTSVELPSKPRSEVNLSEDERPTSVDFPTDPEPEAEPEPARPRRTRRPDPQATLPL